MPVEAPDLRPKMDQYLHDRGLDAHLAEFNSWYPTRNATDEAERIVIPCTNSEGRVYWQARAIDGNEKRYQSAHTDRGESIVLTWPYSEFEPRGVGLCEGPMDALACSTVHLIGVGLMGDTPPPESIEYVVRILRGHTNWFVIPDTDLPKLGSDVLRALARLGVRSRLVRVAPFKDFASLPYHTRLSTTSGAP